MVATASAFASDCAGAAAPRSGQLLGDGPARRSAAATILVVDDEPGVRCLIRAILGLGPHPVGVAEAEDGLQALSVARQKRPDLVFLDVRLPGMDGMSVCRRLKDDPTTAAIPVALVSALADDLTSEAGRAAGADAFVRKPFRSSEILAVVDRLLVRHLVE